MKAHRYKQVDKQFDIHQQAYLNHVVKGTKKVGKTERSLYPTFEDFYNYDEALDNIENPGKEKKVDSVKMKMLNINTEINNIGGE